MDVDRLVHAAAAVRRDADEREVVVPPELAEPLPEGRALRVLAPLRHALVGLDRHQEHHVDTTLERAVQPLDELG